MMTSLFLFLTNFAVFLKNFRCSLPIIRINFAAENKRYSRLCIKKVHIKSV